MEYEVCSWTNKRIFNTEKEARELLLKPDVPVYTPEGKRVKRRMKKRKERRTYYCDDCNGFHLTSAAHYRKAKRNKNAK